MLLEHAHGGRDVDVLLWIGRLSLDELGDGSMTCGGHRLTRVRRGEQPTLTGCL